MMAAKYSWFDHTGPVRAGMQPVPGAATRVPPGGIRICADAPRGSEAFRTGTFRVHTVAENSSLRRGSGVAEVKTAIGKGGIVAAIACNGPGGL